MMSKKDYVAVARVIATQVSALADPEVPDFFPNGEAVRAVRDTALALADYFTASNPAFDRTRFVTACGIVGLMEPAEVAR